ncbi:MAG TPA: hypothetical protein VEI02_02580, partial [Planctomycetota bacterium]|nr:hypothetical protein [Planctomycetota bacterium]
MRRSAVIKKTAARPAPLPVRIGEGAEPAPVAEARNAAPTGEPVVRVRRHGELVEALEVTCPCGHHMVIECLYDAR